MCIRDRSIYDKGENDELLKVTKRKRLRLSFDYALIISKPHKKVKQIKKFF